MQTDLSVVGSQSVQFKEWTDFLVSSAATGSQTDQMRINFYSTTIGLFVPFDGIGDLLLPGTSFQEFSDIILSEGMWWLNVLNPTEEEIEMVSKALSVHSLTVEDIRTQEAVEKTESFKQYYFCSVRSFYNEDKGNGHNLKPTNLYAIVFRGGILTFAFGQSEHASNVRERFGRLVAGARLSGNWICYALIDDIVDGFSPLIRQLEQETSAIEDSTFTTPADDSGPLLRQIYRCRMKNIAALGLLRDKASFIKSFARQCHEQISTASRSEIHLYLSDVQDHVAAMMSDLDHFENMLLRSHSDYLSRLSTSGIEMRNRTVTALRRMALVGGIVMALSIVCGLFGMNVRVPGGDSHGFYWYFGVFGVMVTIVALGLILLRWMRRARHNKWSNR